MTEKPYEILDTPHEELLKSNPKISKSVIEQYRELEKKLEKFGADTKPRYTLSPPLSGTLSNLSKK